MAIQVGTVDGLVNISEQSILCFVRAIAEFSTECIAKARELNISLGTAFQRFIEPVYKNGETSGFNIDSLSIPVLTKSGKEQSPSRVTYCKKMGLLDIDEDNGIFRLTQLGEQIFSSNISVKDYAFFLLSKQNIFLNKTFKDNVLCLIAEWFISNTSINEASFRQYIINKYEDYEIIKTRFDILLNTLVFSGILSNIDRGTMVLSNLESAQILSELLRYKNDIGSGVLDTDYDYTNYIGTMSCGVLDIHEKSFISLLYSLYPKLAAYVKFDFPEDFNNGHKHYLRAMRTKPVLLLAGISGTGKSRIVKEMAFDSCPDNSELRKDPTSPGNYCLVEVKPNWHDSTELLGYESKINGAEYVATPFVKFLAKAMLHENTPFFVCLDEMNLAPVEQYFAEFLSVLESRKRVGDTITSEPLIKASVFKDYEAKLKPLLFDIKTEAGVYDGTTTADTTAHYGKENSVYDLLKEQGLRIPANVVVIGTVNMDETTHQFSRKVIDRAMTIEMNLPEGDPFMDFYDSRELVYREEPLDASLYLPTKVSASEALEELAENNAEKTEWLKGEIAKILTDLNAQLEGTPFKVAYRVQNELLLYFYEVWRENKEADWNEILNDAVDQILMMKVLPRVEGDEDLLEKPLARLADFCAQYPNASKKIEEMKTRLDRAHFTSYWP